MAASLSEPHVKYLRPSLLLDKDVLSRAPDDFLDDCPTRPLKTGQKSLIFLVFSIFFSLFFSSFLSFLIKKGPGGAREGSRSFFIQIQNMSKNEPRLTPDMTPIDALAMTPFLLNF